MATLLLSGGEEEFAWKITGLSSIFKTANYTEAGITRSTFTVGGVTSISGIVDSISATSSGTNTYTPLQFVNYSPGTYTFYGYVLVPAGTYWPAGSATVTITAPAPVIVVDAWSWSVSNGSATTSQTSTAYSVALNHGVTSNFSYLVWNDMIDKINEVVVAAGYSWDSTCNYGEYKNDFIR
jgi:hypothetical protein